MKYLKTLGLAAIAAMALTAVIGVGTASATHLYSNGTSLALGSTIKASLATETSSNLTTTEGTVLNTCTASSVEGKTTTTGTATSTEIGTVAATGLTWSNCTAGPVNTLKGGELEIHWISGTTNGTLTAKGFEVTTETFLGKCTFVTASATHLGTLTGSTTGNATMDINAIVTRKVGDTDAGFCPSSARWQGTYTVTAPTKLYVEEK
jgi:hypothetical protein